MQRPIKTKLVARHANCRHCQACMLACSMLHEDGRSSLDLARLSVKWSVDRHQAKLTICRHCKQPKCLEADCPNGAISQESETGLVLIDPEICIGCGACRDACPFEAIILDPAQGVCKKCDLCRGREQGPACVEICPVAALDLKGRKPS